MLATVAAFVAAAAAIVNVVLTARFARTAALESWRRDRIHPLVVAMLTASYNHELRAASLLQVSHRTGDQTLQPRVRDHLIQELRNETAAPRREMTAVLAELQLVAPDPLVQAAARLHVEHTGYEIAEDFPDQAASPQELSEDVSRARVRLVQVARQEIGVDHRRSPTSPRLPGWIRRIWRS